MRRFQVATCALALAVAVSCARGARPDEPTPTERTLAARLEAMTYRGLPRARVGDVALERTWASSVRAVSDATRNDPARRPGDAERDLRIEAKIRGAFSLDPLLAPMLVDVDVDGGVVRLSGELASSAQAARALTIALATPGVSAVESRCTWVVERERRVIVERSLGRRVR